MAKNDNIKKLIIAEKGYNSSQPDSFYRDIRLEEGNCRSMQMLYHRVRNIPKSDTKNDS